MLHTTQAKATSTISVQDRSSKLYSYNNSQIVIQVNCYNFQLYSYHACGYCEGACMAKSAKGILM